MPQIDNDQAFAHISSGHLDNADDINFLILNVQNKTLDEKDKNQEQSYNCQAFGEPFQNVLGMIFC
ncbi:hypothetical protein [Ruegeria sp. Ofav3-42]|uniref:hypothetical protein n=1 Tax=Ruegeria sp. Ofav3-42 TaxID=2917759 RepID=UPI001EF4E469|nr:hypothetical protein [Ruegeria sp. Ofav3-42]MCG7520489.1 hypothetical protein [Ruegeria sp. Ofav3-42]